MAETKKYVRIKKAKFLRNWYSVYIGRTYIVIGENESEYITHVGNVLKEDAELVVTEKRPAKVGEHVLITNPLPIVKQAYEAGDVFDVAIADDPIPGGVKVVGLPSFIAFREYEVIVNSEVKNEEADGMENVNQTVINNANTVFEKKDDKYFGYKSRFGDIVIGGAYSYRFVVHYAKTNQDVVIISGDVNTVTTPVCTTLEERLWKPEKSAQALRDEIVEQAKADVEDLFKRDIGYRHDFIVNSEKRTVVALRKSFGEGYVRDRGITKATPDDCFNVHIGKAIALRRALGLAVPDEYLNAPQPTEVRVGDVVQYSKRCATVVAGRPNGFGETKLTTANGLATRIIDDSREEVIGE